MKKSPASMIASIARKCLPALLLFPVGAAHSAPTGVPAAVTLRCGTLLDVEGKTSLRDMAIEVEGGKIKRIMPWARADRPEVSGEVVDLSADTCLPGLFDLHTHLSMQPEDTPRGLRPIVRSSASEALQVLRRAQSRLNNGFTTLRVVGEMDPLYSSLDVRNAINRGEFEGPRMIVAQHALGRTGGPGDLNMVQPGYPELVGAIVRAGPYNVREAVREERKRGSDWIKVLATDSGLSATPLAPAFTEEELAAFVDEAHRLGMKITAHVHGNRTGEIVARLGFDSIEHGNGFDDVTVGLMKKKHVALIPTRYVIEVAIAQAEKDGADTARIAQIQGLSDAGRDTMLKAYRAGVLIGAGSDSTFPLDQAVHEFAALARSGLPPWEVLRSGTINAARILGLDAEIGSLEPGKLADIVAVSGDPLADAANLAEIRLVMKSGRIIRRDGRRK